MKRYIFNEQKIEDEYKYIFLCGTMYGRNNLTDKRNVLRAYLSENNSNFRPIILEDNFMFGKSRQRLLRYGDIYMNNLYQVEMVMNYLSDSNIIIQESISTGAEVGLFLSEPGSLKKTCLLVPDKTAVEEDKLGTFIRLAFVDVPNFVDMPNKVDIITFYPEIEENLVSENVKHWHTHFYKNKIGTNLGENIIHFFDKCNVDYKIQFSNNIKMIENGYIYYKVIHGSKLEIKLIPRVLLCCIASILNIEKVSRNIFGKSKKMKVYIREMKEVLQEVFINTIGEKTGADIQECFIKAQWNISGVYIGQIIGMSLYLFQAAGFIKIKKDKSYIDNREVKISRVVLKKPDGTNFFFYEKYKQCIGTIAETQIL